VEKQYFSGFDLPSSETRSTLMSDALPQYFQPKNSSETVIICLHGFTGTPYEIAPLGEALVKKGLSAVIPTLPGHGYQENTEQKKQFASINQNIMIKAVQQEIEIARKYYRHVGIFGFSMGGAIALSMAALGLIDAVAVAAPALRLPRKAEILIPILSRINFTIQAPISEPFYLPGYEFYHSFALKTLFDLSKLARNQLSEIKCPVLGIHSHSDKIVPPIVLGLMQSSIQSEIEIAWFDNSGHSMLLDCNGEEVALKVANFFETQFNDNR